MILENQSGIPDTKEKILECHTHDTSYMLLLDVNNRMIHIKANTSTLDRRYRLSFYMDIVEYILEIMVHTS